MTTPRPMVLAGLFMVLVAVAGLTALSGFHALKRVGEYREANFNHLAAASEAKLMLRTRPSGSLAASDLVPPLRRVEAEARWCIESVSVLERRVLDLIAGKGALALCREDLATVETALSRLVRGGSEQLRLSDRALLDGDLQSILAHSLDVRRYVDRVEAFVMRGVQVTTIAVSVAMAGLACAFGWWFARSLRIIREQEATARKVGRRFDMALQASSDGFAIYDPDLLLVGCNDVYRQVWTDDPQALRAGMHVTEVVRLGVDSGRFGPLSEDDCRALVADSALHVSDATRGRTRRVLNGDRHVEFRVRQTELGDRVVVMRDVTGFVRREREQHAHAVALERAKSEIEHNALHDPLTGLPNRRLLDSRLADALAEGATAIIRLDLDRFKQVNDVLGHAAGDHVLQSVADRLRSVLREGDLAARVGGDEFVILTRAGTDLAEAERLAEEAQRAVVAPVRFAGKPCRFGASLGVARGGSGPGDGGELLSHADAALYKAKQRGRGKVEVFSPELHARIIEERRLGDEFVAALESGQIVPFFQTQHAAGSGALVGVEVLARWVHPRLGLLAPQSFLPVIRTLGYEGQLDAVIFDGALEAADRILRAGGMVPRLSFNVSTGRLQDPGFLKATRRLLSDAPFAVAFELLESISVSQMDEGFLMAIDALKEAGAEIEIDDFGSDHASMATLMRVAPHGVKIDRSLIEGLEEDNIRMVRMIKAIIDMGRALDLRITAEGVESAAQQACLERLGCDVLQGFHLSTPEPADSFCDASLGQSRAAGS